MYRFRLYQQVLYGHYNEFFAAVEELNAIEKSKGRTPVTVWSPTIGENNLVALESEYPDLASFQKDSDAFSQDAESMRVFRSMAPLIVQGSARTELWESAGAVA
jgi:NIPSNAP protein